MVSFSDRVESPAHVLVRFLDKESVLEGSSIVTGTAAV